MRSGYFVPVGFPPNRLRPLVYAAGLLLLTVVVYLPTLSYGFVYEDASWHPGVVTPITLAPQISWSYWSLSLSAWMGEGDAWAFHAGNVLVHLVNGGLVGLLARRMGLDPLTAAWAMGLFLLHPIQSEAVAYSSGRTDLVSTTLVLAACLLEMPWAVAAGVLAVCAKASAVVVGPLTALARQREGRAWHWHLPMLGAFAIFAGVWTFWPHGAEFVDPYLTQAEDGPWRYAWWQVVALVQLIGLTVCPVGLSIDHDLATVPVGLRMGALAAFVLAGVAIWRARETAPWTAFAASWVVVALAPRFVLRIPELMHEHHFYLPFVGVSLWAAACLEERTVA